MDFRLKSELRLRLLSVSGSKDELVLRLAKAVNYGVKITEDEKSPAPSTCVDREEEVKSVDYPIAFLDLEFKHYTILEVGIVLVDPKTWNYKEFSVIIRQSKEFMESYVGRSSLPRTTLEDTSSPWFRDAYETIFYCLNGRTVIGHNIERCDMVLIRDRCFDLGLRAPVPKEVIDTYKWIKDKTKDKTIKNLYPKLRLADLARQFELGEQTHRAIEDCFLNIEVFKRVLASKNLLEILGTEKSDNTVKRKRGG
ncbi:Exonuclease RNase T/DNA polymerase III [Arabidopsis suecica]|uniref:Exonuclease RNase T/DNA polymerase III n=1 Tax=Arabidopsis suecica TaxID=45249 RepID=A0A8T1ZGX1_ARASU|nr:Exonuclease RNase T/DNA polymerase III [Arabidopsis suecica]